MSDLDAYCDRLLRGETAAAYRERLRPEAKARETLIMALRRVEGIDRATFTRWTGYDLREVAPGEVADLCCRGYLTWEGDRLRLTDRALFLSDAVFRELV